MDAAREQFTGFLFVVDKQLIRTLDSWHEGLYPGMPWVTAVLILRRAIRCLFLPPTPFFFSLQPSTMSDLGEIVEELQVP